MGSRSPKRSQISDHRESNQRITRSSDYKRPSIHDKEPEMSPYKNVSLESGRIPLEGSLSPSGRKEKRLYPDLESSDESESRESTQSPQKNYSDYSRSEEREKTPHPNKKQEAKEEKSTSLPAYICAAVLVIVIAAVVFALSSKSKGSVNTTEINVDCSEFMSLNEMFINQDKKLFRSLQAGIEGMYKRTPQVPSVVTFFSTNESAMNSVLEEVIKVAKKCINQSHDPLTLTSKDLNVKKFLDDHRRVISDYKDKLKERTIMIINNIDQIHSSVVGSLHSFTDTINPLVSESVVYLTVKVPEVPRGNKANYIYKYLQEQWKGLAENIKGPLITRFLDQSFYINDA